MLNSNLFVLFFLPFSLSLSVNSNFWHRNIKDVPVVPTVMGRVTFLDFNYNTNLSDDLFEIPEDYVQDTERFVDVS